MHKGSEENREAGYCSVKKKKLNQGGDNAAGRPKCGNV